MDDVDLFIRTSQSREVERDAIDRQAKQFLALGGEISGKTFKQRHVSATAPQVDSLLT